jgi:hypothetical protein
VTESNATGDPRLDDYVEAAVQHLLTENAQIAEQGITVSRREHTLLLCGDVESPHRRDEIVRLVREKFPDLPLVADIGVIRANVPTEAEEL